MRFLGLQSWILQVVLLQLYGQHRHFEYPRYNQSLIASEPSLQILTVHVHACSPVLSCLSENQYCLEVTGLGCSIAP